MIFLLLILPLVTVFSFVLSEKFLYININKLTTNDPVVLVSKNRTPKLKTFNELYVLTDKKWNQRLKFIFNATITVYFSIITVIIYEIIQYEQEEGVRDSRLKNGSFQQSFLIEYYMPLMMKILSVILSLLFPFIIILLTLRKFNLVKRKNLVLITLSITILIYQGIINNIINVQNKDASILLKLALLGLLLMSILSAIGCVVTTYYHYFLSEDEAGDSGSVQRYSIIQLFKQIIKFPTNTVLYSCLTDMLFLYYCNFKNLLTIFVKLPKNLANLDLIYGLDKITKETAKNKEKVSSNPMVVTVVNVINFFYYSSDEKFDEVFLIKVISILLSFSLFLLCFNYIFSFLRNGLAILMYSFDSHFKNTRAPAVESVSNKELPLFNIANKNANMPSHIKNFIFLEFLGIYILATLLVILKLFLTREFEEYITRYVLSNWMSVNVQKTQSSLINTDGSESSTNLFAKLALWCINLPQFPLLNKLVIINFRNNGNILDNIQSLFDLSFEITWCVLIVFILAFECYRMRYFGSSDRFLITFLAQKYRKFVGFVSHAENSKTHAF